jgi:hypothetical protein
MKNKLTKLYSFIKDNDLTEMMKNTSIGYSLKKVIALVITIVFCYLQIANWSDANGVSFLTIDAGLITSILITHAVQNGKNNSGNEDETPNEPPTQQILRG